jgi:N-acetylmuramic acid 6-phosphate etherase
VCVETGPEAIAGSTRLKAGTAQKLVLNGFSTALMVRLGKTYSNLMVDVAPNNAKLRGRILGILEEATGAPPDRCARALRATDGDTKAALVSLMTGVDAATAGRALERTGRRVRVAVEELGGAMAAPANLEAPGGDGMS